MQPDNQLLRTFADPTLVAGLTVGGWELLLAQARMAGLTARLSYRIEDAASSSPSCRPACERSSPPPEPPPQVAGEPSSGRSTGCITC